VSRWGKRLSIVFGRGAGKMVRTKKKKIEKNHTFKGRNEDGRRKRTPLTFICDSLKNTMEKISLKVPRRGGGTVGTVRQGAIIGGVEKTGE